MSEETKTTEEKTTETATTEKTGFFKKSWSYIVTAVTCIAVSVGVTLGADAAKVRDTLTRAEAHQVAVAAATYSAEQILSKVTVVATKEGKAQAIKEVIGQVIASMPEFMKGVEAAKAIATDVKETVKEAKEKVTGAKTTATTEAKKVETKAAETKTETTVPATK